MKLVTKQLDFITELNKKLSSTGLNFVSENWRSSKTVIIFSGVIFSYFLNLNAGLNSLDDYQEVIYAVIAISSGFIVRQFG